MRRPLLLATVVLGGLVWLALALAQGDPTRAGTEERATSKVSEARSDKTVSQNTVSQNTTSQNPTQPSEPAILDLPVPLPAPRCVVGDEPAPSADLRLWPYTVLDTRFRLAADYHPDDLVEIVDVLTGVLGVDVTAAATPGQLVREVIVDDLRALFVAAEAAGQLIAVQSAFRSYTYQETTFAYWVDLDGYETALRSSARAGHSEHQLGTTVDFRSRHGPAAWDVPDWAETSEGAFLAANAWRYGFVMSYPKGAETESCYSYEPWHYRYLGRDLAAQVHASGLTPRILLWRLSQELDEASHSN